MIRAVWNTVSGSSRALAALALVPILFSGIALADPCGMVPPISSGEGPPITRIGVQKTYVFYRDGLETFVIRPGFRGRVEEFGMLIPFPTPPAIRKVDDAIFGHLAAAVDPPEVVIDLRPKPAMMRQRKGGVNRALREESLGLEADEVRVLREEAVGMYEVAVLEAGSPRALARWMSDHGYRYPEGMDAACNDYVEDGWCFVAVKTRVGRKRSVAPRPGMREADPKLPEGVSFDGFVQAMGFRFRSEEFVVPMRLSSFNEGDLRNVTYILTDRPVKIDQVPAGRVVRQLSGDELRRNITELLPVRILGGEVSDVTEQHWERIAADRNPARVNGLARDLFASDLLAVRDGRLAHSFEETEKVLLRIGERLNLRGPAIDRLNGEALAESRRKILDGALGELEGMTLTVVDGDFPREVIARENLRFTTFQISESRNHPTVYDAKAFGPAPNVGGVRHEGVAPEVRRQSIWVVLVVGLVLCLVLRRRVSHVGVSALLLGALLLGGTSPVWADEPPIVELIDALGDPAEASGAVDALVGRGSEALPHLLGEAIEGSDLARRGWSIVCLAEIGIRGEKVVDRLGEILHDEEQPMLVRTWAAAARVDLAEDLETVVDLAGLLPQFPALERPIGMKAVAYAGAGEVTELLELAVRVPQIQAALVEPILARGAEALAAVLVSEASDEVRNRAAGFLGALAKRGAGHEVARAVADAYAFEVGAQDVPWSGGALWIPSIGWSAEPARELVGNLLRWHLWCNENGRQAEQAQIHNNIRSLGLARAAGYQSPGWQEVGTVEWLVVWGNAVGRDEVFEMLQDQGVESKYQKVLDRIGK